jgi:hypothetical protein
MSPRPFVFALFLVAAASVASCTDPLAPRDIAGTYVLRTIRGDSLPTRLNAGSSNSPILLADTLLISSNGNGLWIDVYDFEPAAPGFPRDTVRFTMQFRIVPEGGQLLLVENFTCQPGFTCRDPEVYAIGRWEGELVLGDGPRYYRKLDD